ncbi:peptide MFS transporter [Novosphingobium lentum]|uniref:peptide MFS transporter n=1 Tax=Novosphingobium lentum TaxID=145287 RepID=UPI0008352D52|nr:peptide MFS transporter [Novosphingobium lentum]
MATTPSPPPLFGHPRGLWVLAATELWDRISFKGMQAMLVLYMAGDLLQPDRIGRVAGFGAYRRAIEALTGPLSTEALATQTFGLYIALVTLTPLAGGLIGDRWTGRRKAVTAGALLMTAGHFALAFDAAFLPALLLLILGVGLFRGNLSAQVKALYADGDRRQADAFQIYLIAVNLGGFVAPLLTGALAKAHGWHAGFAAAGIGMLVGLAIYLAGSRNLPEDRPRDRTARIRTPLNPAERRRLAGLFALWPLLVCFWIAQSQVWNVYNLWARDHVAMVVGDFDVPVPWLASLDSLAPVVFAPLVIALWRAQARRGIEPAPVTKLAIGCLLFAGAVALLMLGSLHAGTARMALAWPIAFHFASNLGWLYFVPVETSVFAAAAPDRLRGTMLGVASLAVSAGSIISGRMGSLYEAVDPARFWAINAGIVAMAGIVLLLARKPVGRLLGG